MSVVAIDRCLDLVEALAAKPDGCSLTELATRFDLAQSAVHRMLMTLIDHRYVRQDPATHIYTLSLRFAALGFRFLDARHLPDAAQVVLDRLARDTEEYCRLGLVENDEMIWVASAQGATLGLRYEPPMTDRVVLHATASGKAWLADLPEADALRIVYAQGFPVPPELNGRGMTGRNLIMTIDDLRADLARTGERGYALAEEEGEAGTAAIAVGFRADPSPDAPVIGTISVAGPLVRFAAEQRPRLVERLVAAAGEMSQVWPVWQRQRRRDRMSEYADASAIAPPPRTRKAG